MKHMILAAACAVSFVNAANAQNSQPAPIPAPSVEPKHSVPVPEQGAKQTEKSGDQAQAPAKDPTK
jgi:hypothetical protein